MRKSIVNTAIVSAIAAAIVSTGANAVPTKILDKTLQPAGNFLAYTEFELSGEPLAEALGLDLDMLDPNIANSPTAFDLPTASTRRQRHVIWP